MNFLLFSQGPLYRFYLWSGLAKEPLLFCRRRILTICLIAWLPLLILTMLSRANLSMFISDIDVHARFLISLALLLYAEVIANDRFEVVARQFLKCHIILAKDLSKYNAIAASAINLSRSWIAELLLLIFLITVGGWISNQVLPYDISIWNSTTRNNIATLTLPGYWYVFVSLPIFQFILLRWYYRIFIWYRFLWQVSRLKLKLNSLHPDRAGGIGFIVNGIYAMEPFLMAHSFLLAGIILNFILNTDATLWQFKYEIITWLTILLFIPITPMAFFILQLTRAKRDGTNDYEVLANRYVFEFRKKWIESDSHQEELLGNPDIQTLSDLSNSFNVSERMHVMPISKNTLFFIFIFTSLPFVPLLFTVMPIEKILMQVISIVF